MDANLGEVSHGVFTWQQHCPVVSIAGQFYVKASHSVVNLCPSSLIQSVVAAFGRKRSQLPP